MLLVVKSGLSDLTETLSQQPLQLLQRIFTADFHIHHQLCATFGVDQ